MHPFLYKPAGAANLAGGLFLFRFFMVMNKMREEMTPERVKALRVVLGLSQAKFAAALGMSLGAVRHWEQGIRLPDGAACKLLRVLEKHPELIDG